MGYPDHDPQRQLVLVRSDSTIDPGPRWLKQIVRQHFMGSKPGWMHLPDRVWRRNSALLMSMQERR